MNTRKMISVSKHISPLTLACNLALIVCIALTGYAQDENPQRGFYPGGSYGISDIEKFNTVNGNLILNIPIAALPPGRAGLSAGVNLIYNSKLWDTDAEQLPNCANQLVTQHFLYQSFWGGWRYGFQFQPEILIRADGKKRIEMAFPDGSVHALRPVGFTGPDDPGGYYAANFANMIWYSTDGSYFRVQFGSGSNFYNTPWTIYFPDGSRVTGGDSPQRIYDRNNNYVEFQNITWNGHPAHKIVDELGRHIIIEKAAVPYDPGQDYIHVWGVGGQQMTWTIKWKTVAAGKTYKTVSESNPCDVDGLFAYLWVVDQIILPSQAGSLAYTFGYNAPDYPGSSIPSYGHGEVSSITLPTGAQASYSYSHDGDNHLWYKRVLENRANGKTLSYQREYDGSSTQVTEAWGPGDVISPDGGRLREFFYPLEGGEFWKRGLVFKSELPDGTVVERIWQTNSPYGAVNVNPYVKTEFTSIMDASGALVKTAIKDFIYDKNGNVTQVTEYDWVDYGSVPRDGSGKPIGIPSANSARVTTNTYYSPTPDASDNTTDDPNVYHKPSSPNLRNAIASREVLSSVFGMRSRAEFFYDNAFTTGNLIEQKSWDSTKGFITNPLTPANSISVTHQYDPHGNRTLTTDAKGVQTQFIYDPINGHGNLYVTQAKVAAGTPVQRWTTQAFDFNTGLVTQSIDMDNNVTNEMTYDAFGRPTIAKEAVGTANERWTRTEYNDQARRVVVRAALDATDDQKLVTVRHYDQLGRICLSRRLENPNDDVTNEALGIKVQTRYYAGDVNNPDPAYQNTYQAVSNPYRAATSSAAGIGENGFTMGWARTKFDKGKRVIETQTFDANLPLPWGTGSTGTGIVTMEYDGENTTVTDQAGKKRRSQTDALGRLKKMTEDPGGLNYETTYLYDVLDNLLRVTQGAQTRWFAYDSLLRLIRAKNPEQSGNSNLSLPGDGTVWAMAYSYDANGNLTERIDARGVVTSYSYDALNRNTGTNYINGSQTRSVEIVYDGAANGKGRLHYERTKEDGVNSTETKIDSYDALGRALNKQQSFWQGSDWGDPYVIQQSYDLAGNVKSLTYPSGHIVNYSHDQAGRLSGFSGNLGDGANRNYATGMQYDAAGSMKREHLGTNIPLYHRRHYNNRGQLFDIRLGTDPNPLYDSDDLNAWAGAAGSWNRGSLRLYYSTLYGCHVYGSGGTGNNGNPLRMDHHIPLDDAVSNFVASIDRYDYDPLNRLKSATELSYTKGPSGEDAYQGIFGQAFLYDRWGNRTIDQANTTGGVNEKAYTVDAATNRLTAVDGVAMSYDAAGNQTNDGSGQRVYDGENRMVEAYNSVGVRVSWYVYNAEGRRVVRTVGSQGTWQIYGCGGELLAEYAVGAASSAAQKEYGYRSGQLLVVWDGSETGDRQLQWLVQDHLGSTRMVVDRSGSLTGVRRHDYLPFGEELFAGVGIRSESNGYSGDSVRQKFGSKERDNETGLDFFISRYFSSTQGRYISPDHFSGNPATLMNSFDRSSALPYAILSNPQTLNLYSFVENNPLSLIDPDGHMGKREKLGRYTVRIDRNNPNDAPNIHVFDGKKEIGRVALKESGPEFSGELAKPKYAGLQRQLLEYAESKGIRPRTPDFGGGTGATGGRGGGVSRVFIGLTIAQLAIDILSMETDRRQLGYFVDLFGRLVIDDLNKAVNNLPRGTTVDATIDGYTYHFVLIGKTFITTDPSCEYCTLDQDKNGRFKLQGKRTCCD